MFSTIVIPYIIIFHTWYHESNIICFTVKWLKVFRDMKISKCCLRNIFILTECLIWSDDFIRLEPNCYNITIFSKKLRFDVWNTYWTIHSHIVWRFRAAWQRLCHLPDLLNHTFLFLLEFSLFWIRHEFWNIHVVLHI